MDSYVAYLHESRHIFSICPECGEVHRLSDMRLMLDEKFEKDWLDKLDNQRKNLEEKIVSLQDKAKEMKEKAKEKLQKSVMPQLLRNAAPVFACKDIDVRDVRTLLHPVEYVAFEGMYSTGGVRQISFLYTGDRNDQIRSIEDSISKRHFDWNTLRLDDEGIIQQSKHIDKSKKYFQDLKEHPFQLDPNLK
jgi:predicted Holliday junction resolvase-like endonuclease